MRGGEAGVHFTNSKKKNLPREKEKVWGGVAPGKKCQSNMRNPLWEGAELVFVRVGGPVSISEKKAVNPQKKAAREEKKGEWEEKRK